MAAAESDKWEVIEKIGQGSFGVINKVRRKSDGRVLCRKEISYRNMSQKEKEQLQAELNILRELKHENIVSYEERELFRDREDLHLYMEYCGNGDLGQVIRRHRKINTRVPEEFVWNVFAQLVTALYRCHYGHNPLDVGSNILGVEPAPSAFRSKKQSPIAGMVVIHRDLKPENDHNDNVKLGDFGLSKLIKSHDFASTYVGTPYYMSPEVCGNERYTTASDIWSLGCIMYELCSWSPPFNARSHIELFTKIKIGKVQPLPPQYSQELQNVINSCLQVNSNRRPTAENLIGLPVVKLYRKTQQCVSMSKQIKELEKDIATRLQHAQAGIEAERAQLYDEITEQVRREWEVKAALEIDKHTKMETARLQQLFAAEVSKEAERLAEPYKQRIRDLGSRQTLSRRTSAGSGLSGITRVESADIPSSTGQTVSSSTSPDAQLQRLSLESSSEIKPVKRVPRASLTRAHTTTNAATSLGLSIASPADIVMGEPSPANFTELALSPRRDPQGIRARAADAKANIFAAAAKQRWQPTNASALNSPAISDVDTSEAEDADAESDIDLIPSPCRDPFKTVGKRPSLARQTTMPANIKRMTSAPFFSKKTTEPKGAATPGLTVKRPSSAVPVVTTSPTRSPTRRAPAGTVPVHSPPASRGTISSYRSKLKDASNPLLKTATRNYQLTAASSAVTGRTLVELAQARAGGVPDRDKTAKGFSEPPVWNPETDEMPSPFLVRGKFKKAQSYAQ